MTLNTNGPAQKNALTLCHVNVLLLTFLSLAPNHSSRMVQKDSLGVQSCFNLLMSTKAMELLPGKSPIPNSCSASCPSPHAH